MVSVPIQLRMNDLDAFNHVNNGSQCHILDYGRTQFFEQTLGEEINWLTFDLVIVHIELDFKAPIMIHDDIICTTKVIHVGKSSVRLEQRLIDRTTGVVKTISQSVAVSIDRTAPDSHPVSKPLPEKYLQKIKVEE